MKSPKNLREPGFLLDLARYVGKWKTGKTGIVRIQRRDDGSLEARIHKTGERVMLLEVIDKAKRLEGAPSPFGFYPIALSHPLMRHWLAPQVFLRLSNAWRVGPGIRMIIEALEKRIGELSDTDRDRLWIAWWEDRAKSASPLDADERAAHRVLYQRCKAMSESTPTYA